MVLDHVARRKKETVSSSVGTWKCREEGHVSRDCTSQARFDETDSIPKTTLL